MKRTLGMLLAVALLMPVLSFGATAKKYQVTGKVLEVSPTLIVVEKGDEKWEINRDADTKVDGKLEVGSKVTIQYRMTAMSVEVKADKSAEKKK